MPGIHIDISGCKDIENFGIIGKIPDISIFAIFSKFIKISRYLSISEIFPKIEVCKTLLKNRIYYNKFEPK